MADLESNDMLDSLIIDLWNEPDGTGFWPRTWDQFLEYWNRAFVLARYIWLSSLDPPFWIRIMG